MLILFAKSPCRYKNPELLALQLNFISPVNIAVFNCGCQLVAIKMTGNGFGVGAFYIAKF